MFTSHPFSMAGRLNTNICFFKGDFFLTIFFKCLLSHGEEVGLLVGVKNKNLGKDTVMNNRYSVALIIAMICFVSANIYGKGDCSRPEEVTAISGNCFIRLNWSPVDGATSYAVYIGPVRIAVTQTPFYTHETGCVYCFECPPATYSVSAICDNTESARTYSEPVQRPCYPSLDAVGSFDQCDHILINWNVAGSWDEGAFDIYRSIYQDGPSTAILIGSTMNNYYYDVQAISGVVYYYWVVGISMDGCLIQDDTLGLHDCVEVECDSDINNDSVTDVNDLLVVVAQWGTPGSADVNSDGTVNVSDLLIVIDNWGPCE